MLITYMMLTNIMLTYNFSNQREINRWINEKKP